MELWTLQQIAALAGASETSVLRKDIYAGRLKATKYGNAWLVEEAEARRWAREDWPEHVRQRDKPPAPRAPAERMSRPPKRRAPLRHKREGGG